MTNSNEAGYVTPNAVPRMKNSEIFYGELQLIKSVKLREATRRILDECVPDYFYVVAASSTGKYHPWYSLGYGGLVRHTKAAVKIAYDLLQLEQYQGLDEDACIVALILHDTFKHGTASHRTGYTVAEHPIVAVAEINHWVITHCDGEMIDTFTFISDLIASHMGQWNGIGKNQFMPKPETDNQKFVHLCDYLASRKYIVVEVN